MQKIASLILAFIFFVCKAQAVLHITVPVDSLAVQGTIITAELFVYGSSGGYEATAIHEPQGAPASWILEFALDDSLNTIAVDSVHATAICNLDVSVQESKTWTPSPFSLFYQDGPFTIPVLGDFGFDSELCSGIETGSPGDWNSISLGSKAWEYELISSTSSGVELEFLQNGFFEKTIAAGGQTWERLSFGRPGGTLTDSLKAELPTYVVWLDVPDSGSVSLGTVESAIESYSDRHIYPVQFDSMDFAMDTTFYSTNEWFPSQNVWLGSPTIVRHERVVPLRICPFSYNPALDSLIVFSSIYVDVNFSSTAGVNELTALPGGGLTPQDTLFYQRLLVNYQRDDAMRTDNGAYLGLTIDEYEPALDSLLSWKRKQGFETHSVIFSTTPSEEQVRDSVRFYYEEFGISYLLIMGDHDQIPQQFIDSGSNMRWRLYSDWWYTFMDFDEANSDTTRFSDIAVGRMSTVNTSSSVDELWDQVNNTIIYDTKANSSWDYERAQFVVHQDLDIHDPSISMVDTLQERTDFADVYVLDGTLDEATEVLLNSALARTAGSGITLYMGHGTEGSWEWWNNLEDDNFLVSECLSLPARPQGPVYSFACNTADVNPETQCLGESFLQQPTGNPAYVGCTFSIQIRYGVPMMYESIGIMYTGEVLSDLGLSTMFVKGEVEAEFMNPDNVIHRYGNRLLQRDINSLHILGDPALNLRQPGFEDIELVAPPMFRVGLEEVFAVRVSSASPTAKSNVQIRVFYQDSLLFSDETDNQGVVETEFDLPGSWTGNLEVVGYKPGYRTLREFVSLDVLRPFVTIELNAPDHTWDLAWEALSGENVCYHIYKSTVPYFDPQADEGIYVDTTTETNYSYYFGNLSHAYKWFRVVAEFDCEE